MTKKKGDAVSGACAPGEVCHWTIDDGTGNPGCNPGGGGDCSFAVVLEAEISDFHDKALSKATEKIKKALEAIPADKQGRKLSFIKTRQGVLLAWVNHGGQTTSTNAVSGQSKDAAIAKALKLKK